MAVITAGDGTPRRTRVAPPVGVPTEDEIRAARRALALHRRRRYPDTAVCGLCGYRWQAGITPSGLPSRGCLRRRHVLDVLDVAGQLDDQGRPTTPAGASTP